MAETQGIPDLISVVVPAYLQEATIQEDLKRLKEVLTDSGLAFEIIVVADGTLDGTFERSQSLQGPGLRVFGYPGRNRGKGYALRFGAAKARGQLVVFLDAGMEIDPQAIGFFYKILKERQADVVIGSKRHKASEVNYPRIRRVTSFFYQLLIFFLFGLNVRDTQTGLKIFRREVLERVMPRLLVKDYAVDIEILAVAYHLGFKKIYEGPVKVSYRFDDLTHAATLNHIAKMIKDTLAVFYRLKIRHYYDDDHERQWVFDPELQMKVNV